MTNPHRLKLLDHVPPQQPAAVPCKIVFVGEAPSDEERLKGRPLVGPSGRVFDQMLRTAGLDRAQYGVTNVFDEQLPQNEVANWCVNTVQWKELAHAVPEGFDPKLADGMYLHPSHWHHLERLRVELAAMRPTLIVPLGGTALWALTGYAGITEARGAVAQAKYLLPGTKLLPTLHPAHVIHEWRMFHIVVADLIKAAAEAEYPDVRLSRRELWLEPTLVDMRHFKQEYIDNADLLSVDIETAAGQITCIGFAPDTRRAIVVPFVDFRVITRSYWPTAEDECAAWDWVADVLASGTPKLFQNGPYDVYWLLDRAGLTVNNYLHDTRLLHHALYPELPKSLGFMGANYAQQGAWKLLRTASKLDEKRDA